MNCFSCDHAPGTVLPLGMYLFEIRKQEQEAKKEQTPHTSAHFWGLRNKALLGMIHFVNA